MKHALFVAFHYPPEASSSGVLRTLKYTRYLVDYGWRTTVIAPAVDAYVTVDPELEHQIPAATRVIRTPFLNTKRHLSVRGLYPLMLAVPDRWIGWYPWGVAAGRRVQAEDPFDLVYSTSPHATAHLIARRIARSAGKPWVADFRDPWIENPPEPGTPNGFLSGTLNRWLERRVVRDAFCIVSSTMELRDLLRARYPKHRSEKIIAILNGYDEADFRDLFVTGAGSGERLTMLHAGSINAEFRNPLPLLRALKECADAGLIDLRKFKLRFLGPGEYGTSSALRKSIEDLGLNDVVELVPRVAYAESLAALASADLLLLLQASEDTRGLVPAKLYEYLRAQKPLLALVHPGAVQEVLSTTGGGWSVAPENQAELRRLLGEIFGLWRAGRLANVRAELAALRRFDRNVLTGNLARVFDGASTGVAPVRDPQRIGEPDSRREWVPKVPGWSTSRVASYSQQLSARGSYLFARVQQRAWDLAVGFEMLRETDPGIDDYRRRVNALHRKLRVPPDYDQRGLPFLREASDLVAVPGIAGRVCRMTHATRAHWLAMQAAATSAGITLLVRCGFRTVDEQANLIREQLRNGHNITEILTRITAPGYSEHHTGRALDIGCDPDNEEFEKTPAFDWLSRNAERFDFALSYPRDNPYGIVFEPWHWRCNA